MTSFLTQKSDISASVGRSYQIGNEFNDTKIQNNYSVDRLTYDLKIILVGNSGVGKTSLLSSFLGNDFNTNYNCTLSVESKTKNLSIDAFTSANLTIWDTCGQERFRSLTKSYFRDAHGILLVYDISDQKSFDDLDLWLKEIKEGAPEKCSILLVGNKIDLPRVISSEDANNFAIKNKLQYFEVSCLEGRFIETPFQNLSGNIVNKIKKGELKIGNNDNGNDLKEIKEELFENTIEIQMNDSNQSDFDINIKNFKKEKSKHKNKKCCF